MILIIYCQVLIQLTCGPLRGSFHLQKQNGPEKIDFYNSRALMCSLTGAIQAEQEVFPHAVLIRTG